MAGRRSTGRRRRPGRRPPHRYRGRGGGARPRGFTGPGFRQLHELMMPGLAGRRRRAFFHEVSGWLVLGCGLGGALTGYILVGPLGAALGLVGGIAAGGRFAEGQRCYRP